VRFFLGPFVTLLARTAALSRVPVAIVPFRFSTDRLKHIRRGFVSPVGLILGCMDPSRPPLVVAFELSQKRKAIVADALAGASAVVYLTELDETARTEALRNTGVLLTFNTSKELQPGEAKLLNSARLIQFMIGGVDFIPLGELPEGVPVATNGGGYAESPPALTPGGLNQYAMDNSALINRFLICRTSSPHRTTRHRVTARRTSACAAQLRTVAAH